MSKENTKGYAEDFCIELKKLLEKYKVNSFRSEFAFSIEDHSVTHIRAFSYSEKSSGELQILTKQVI